MSKSRTYRHVSLLFAALLLFGAAAPLVQAACARTMDVQETTAMPCHGSDAEELPAHTPCAASALDGASCCFFTSGSAVPAVPAPDALPRLSIALTTLVSAALDAPSPAFERAIPVAPPPLALPAAERRALLSTYLI